MTSPYSAARWHAPLATTGVWGLAAAAAVFWSLRLASPTESVAAAATLPRPPVSADTDALARLLGVVSASGATPAAPEAASRFALSGVIADPSSLGAALIAIDGKPARPFRVGARVGDNYVLQSVGVRAATLGARADGPAAFTLQLPVRAPISVSASQPVSPPALPMQPPGALPATMPTMAPPPHAGAEPPSLAPAPAQ